MQWEYEMMVIGAENPGFRTLTGGQFNDNALHRAMNKLGSQGWELVTAFDTNYIKGATRDIVLLFKRPRVTTAMPADQ